MTIRIEEVTTHKQLDKFIKFPFSIYKGNPYWTPPLLMDEKNTLDWKKNPAFEVSQARYWLAYKDDKVVIHGLFTDCFNIFTGVCAGTSGCGI